MSVRRSQTDPGFRVALSQALKGIRLRLLRQAATGMGVLLGIAFYSSVRTSQALSPVDPADPASIEAASRLEWLAILSLAMCLVGITNAMLMSVTERYREIGTLKCLGSSDGFIVKVFFIEALTIGTISAVAGAVVGVLIVAGLRLFTEGIPPGFLVSALQTVAVSSALGIVLSSLAAVLPAIQAAKMPAAAALRVEV